MKQRGRPVRGFFGGLFLGIFLAFDLVLLGAVNLDSAVLTFLPIAGCVIGLILGIWAPIGRKRQLGPPPIAPLPAPVAWPESAPVEGSTAPTQSAPDPPSTEPAPPPPI